MNRHTSALEGRYLVGIPYQAPYTKQSYSQSWYGCSSRLSLTCGNAEEQRIGHIHFDSRLVVLQRDTYIEYQPSRHRCDASNQ